MRPPLIAIFGAAVRPDGRPSASLLRRIGFGAEAAALYPDAPILCSGGVVRPGPSEASIMAVVLAERGIDPARLILDEASLDTFDNVAACAREVQARGCPYVVVCSDAYHVPRIRLLLRLMGVASLRGPVPRGRGDADAWSWTVMSLREGIALPYALIRLLLRRRALLARAQGAS